MKISKVSLPGKLLTVGVCAMICISLQGCASKPTAESEEVSIQDEKLPNIVLILSDDHAWNDYSFMGHDIVQTPNLDKLAADGITFRHAYVPTSLCRPSLATIATGLYAYQHGITGNNPSKMVPGGKEGQEYHRLRERIIAKIDKVKTLPQLLQDKGYVSLQTGKWWEGSYSRAGFDEGMTRGVPQPGGRHGDDGLKIGRQGIAPITDFIDRMDEQNNPFFVWYAPFMPHAPHTPPTRILEKYASLDLPESIAKYYAMIEWFDETTGQLFEHLEGRGLSDNTLVVYVSDNGWITNPTQEGRFLPKSKQSPNESGVRTPIIYSLPSKFKSGFREDLVSSIDIVPTILGATGIEVPPELPGINLYDNLVNGAPLNRDTVFGEGYAHDMDIIDDPESTLLYRWVIKGDWKLIVSYDGKNASYQKYHDQFLVGPRLYNLAEDEHEKINLAAKYPQKVNLLKDQLEQWYKLEERKMIK